MPSTPAIAPISLRDDEPPYADVPALLARAAAIIGRNTDTATDNATDNSEVLVDSRHWLDDYAAALPALTAPAGAVITIVETMHRHDDPNDGLGILVPNKVTINGMPLLLTDEGPVIKNIGPIDPRIHTRNAATITMTMFARRIVVDAERPTTI